MLRKYICKLRGHRDHLVRYNNEVKIIACSRCGRTRIFDITKKVLSDQELVKFDASSLLLPGMLLRSWGFDPKLEITIYEDKTKATRTYIQEVERE